MSFDFVLDGNGVLHRSAYADTYGRYSCCGRDITAAATVSGNEPVVRCPGCFG